LEKRNRCLF